MATLSKKDSRIRRSGRTRHHIRELGVNRLSVFRSANNIYAQVFTPCGSTVLAAASTLDEEVKSANIHTGNSKAAAMIGALLAKRCKDAGIKQLAFDRSGYRYHGRVKALADAAREGGLEF
jgi:large subunit ribosomal protein L18